MPPLHDADLLLREETRRHFFARCGVGLGAIALERLLRRDAARAAAALPPSAGGGPRHPPRAKRVIFLFMAGGPSQLDMFDHKPELSKRSGEPIPQSFIEGKRFAFMNSSHRTNLLGTRRSFSRHGASGAWASDLVPQLGAAADELTFVRTCKADLFNHAPAKLFMNTGTGQFGRPSLGAWVTYGLGSESEDLPGFVVLQSGPRGPRGGAILWGSGMLPTTFQGVPLRNQGEPILNLTTPAGVDAAGQRRVVEAVRQLNLRRLRETGDDEIATRIGAYEMAWRMQSSAPELMDTTGETRETLDLYGIKDPREASFARNCLLARRLVERGTRFVQLYHTNWDHHGGPAENLETHLPAICGEIDRPCAALVRDLRRRGLLDDTIVVWGGEFGRTPMGEVRESTGRNHHIDAFTMWFAGGGFRPGITHGETDEFGFGPVGPPVHVRDIHATLLHLLGLDHERLAVRSQGLDVRLTGVLPARVVTEVLA
jgi:hypothetical protein